MSGGLCPRTTYPCSKNKSEKHFFIYHFSRLTLIIYSVILSDRKMDSLLLIYTRYYVNIKWKGTEKMTTTQNAPYQLLSIFVNTISIPV